MGTHLGSPVQVISSNSVGLKEFGEFEELTKVQEQGRRL